MSRMNSKKDAVRNLYGDIFGDGKVLCLLNASEFESTQLLELLQPLPGFENFFFGIGKSHSFATFFSVEFARSAAVAILPALQSFSKRIYPELCVLMPLKILPILYSPSEISSAVPGLILIHNFISNDETRFLLNSIPDDYSVLNDRLVQHFGHSFDYNSNSFDDSVPLPDWISPVLDKIHHCLSQFDLDSVNRVDSSFKFDQLTINKYIGKNGISPHVDTHSKFIGPIASLSLCSDIIMEFRTVYFYNDSDVNYCPFNARKPIQNCYKTVQVHVPAQSLLIMTNEARYAFEHSIRTRKHDIIHNKLVARSERISFTFRKVVSEAVCHCVWEEVCDYRIGSIPDRFKGDVVMNRHGIRKA